MLPRRPVYRTFTLERAVGAPRSVAWDALAALTLEPGEDGGLAATTTLSLEPPWRRVFLVPGSGLPLLQGSVSIRDDGDRCLVAWAVIAQEPGEGPDATAAADAELARLRPSAEAALERLAALAESDG